MKNIKNIIYITVAVLVGFAIGYKFSDMSNMTVGAVSPVGVSNTTERMASITVAPLLAAGTSTSVFNTDSVDRNITGVNVVCSALGTSNIFLTGQTSGATLPNFVLQVGTTSIANQGLQGNTSLYASTTIATSTTYGYVATSTEGVIFAVSRIWPTQTYLTFQFNATNTAACTVAAKYLSL